MRSSRGPSKVIYSQNRQLSSELGGGGEEDALATLRLVRAGTWS